MPFSFKKDIASTTEEERKKMFRLPFSPKIYLYGYTFAFLICALISCLLCRYLYQFLHKMSNSIVDLILIIFCLVVFCNVPLFGCWSCTSAISFFIVPLVMYIVLNMFIFVIISLERKKNSVSEDNNSLNKVFRILVFIFTYLVLALCFLDNFKLFNSLWEAWSLCI